MQPERLANHCGPQWMGSWVRQTSLLASGTRYEERSFRRKTCAHIGETLDYIGVSPSRIRIWRKIGVKRSALRERPMTVIFDTAIEKHAERCPTMQFLVRSFSYFVSCPLFSRFSIFKAHPWVAWRNTSHRKWAIRGPTLLAIHR